MTFAFVGRVNEKPARIPYEQGGSRFFYEFNLGVYLSTDGIKATFQRWGFSNV